MRRILLVLVLLSTPGCFIEGDQRVPDPGTPATLEIHTTGGDQAFAVQVASTPEARAIGLMDRESLDPYDGMVFTWSRPARTSFWMKDTLIPLAIAFWDEDWRIVAIFEMDPCTADPCPVYDPGEDILGALEVDQGALDERGVQVGDEVELALPA